MKAKLGDVNDKAGLATCGRQYASADYRRLLKGHQFVGSMSRKGDCWDNSVVESSSVA